MWDLGLTLIQYDLSLIIYAKSLFPNKVPFTGSGWTWILRGHYPAQSSWEIHHSTIISVTIHEAHKYQQMEKESVTSWKTENSSTIWSNSPTSGYLSKRIKISISKRYLHSYVHCSLIHSSEGKNISVHWQMNGKSVVYTYSGILFSPKQEGSSAVCSNTYGPGGRYVKWISTKWNKWLKTNTAWFHLHKVSKTVKLMEGRE